MLLACSAPFAAAQSTHVSFEFNVGFGQQQQNTVYIELFDDRPLSTANFLQYVDGGLYDNSLLHRLVPQFVLQGGGFQDVRQPEPAPLDWSVDISQVVDLDGDLNTRNPTVDNEFDGTRSNTRGTLAYAKVGLQRDILGNPIPGTGPDSATNQWFFNLRDNGGFAPNGLDFQNGGFTTFAEVVGDGLDLVDFLASHRTSNFNPDVNDDGVIDGGALGSAPFFVNTEGEIDLLRLDRARRATYFGSGDTINVPASSVTLTGLNNFIDDDAQFTGPGRLFVGRDATAGFASGFDLPNRLGNAGVLNLGDQIGSLTTAQYSQFDEGVLELQLGGTTAGVTYDQLISETAATLAGELRVSLISGFLPELGDSFTLIESDSIVGGFAGLSLPQLPAGRAWDLQTVGGDVILTVVSSSLFADYNGDNTISTADYQAWADDFGTAGLGLRSDGNSDGIVNAADFVLFRDSVGSAAPPAVAAATAVPEPTTLGGLTLLLLPVALRRRRCCHPRIKAGLE